jgi:hypothetical protein
MPAKEDIADVAELKLAISELLAWKHQQEQNQVERINEMHSVIVDIFVSRHAVTSEILTVIKLLENETATNYINTQKGTVVK